MMKPRKRSKASRDKPHETPLPSRNRLDHEKRSPVSEGSESDETDDLLEVGIAIIIDALITRLLDGAILQRDPIVRAASRALNAAGGWTLELAIDELASELKRRVAALPESSVRLVDEFDEDVLSTLAARTRSARDFWLKEFNKKDSRIPEVMRRRRLRMRFIEEIAKGVSDPRAIADTVGYSEKQARRLMERVHAIDDGLLIAVVQLLDEVRRKRDRST